MGNKYSGERFLPEVCDSEMTIEHKQRYEFAKEYVGGKKVLDAACGEGYGSNILSEAADIVVGMDIDAETVRLANEKYGSTKLTYKVGNAEKLPFENESFDVIVSFETIEHISEIAQENFLSEIRRVLRPDGLLIMSTPNKAIYTDAVNGKNPYHIKEFYTEEFISFMQKRFRNIEVFCQYPDTGYFISKEENTRNILYKAIKRENSRYIITVCSDKSVVTNDTEIKAQFDSSMYYFLNKRSHDLENEIVAMKTETDRFEGQQEESIQKQKDYILKLEKDVQDLKDSNSILQNEKNISQSRIETLQNGIETVQNSLKTVQNSVETAQTGVETVQNSVEAVQNRIEILQSSIEALQSSIEILQGSVEILQIKSENKIYRFLKHVFRRKQDSAGK